MARQTNPKYSDEKYAVESVPVHRKREGLSLAKNYLEVINDRAEAGWNFVQAINFETHSDPRIDLIFRKEEV